MVRSKTTWLLSAMCLTLGVALILVSPAAAQKKKKNAEKEATPTFTLPDPQEVDKDISEMLAAWQIGDLTLLQKYYASDVIVVSGAYEPPLQGWTNYVQAYQRQRERMHSVRLERRNTFIQVKGAVAWAVYQWEMSAQADGKPFGARGHTTLTFEKRASNWVIVHNHTSIVETAQVQQAQPQPAPASPAPGNKPQ